MKDDSITEALQRKYIDRRKAELIDMEVCLVRQDFSNLKSFGHKLKGNGSSFGYDELTEFGSLIEESAKEKDLEKTQVYFNQIKNFINQQF